MIYHFLSPFLSIIFFFCFNFLTWSDLVVVSVSIFWYIFLCLFVIKTLASSFCSSSVSFLSLALNFLSFYFFSSKFSSSDASSSLDESASPLPSSISSPSLSFSAFFPDFFDGYTSSSSSSSDSYTSSPLRCRISFYLYGT